MIRKIVGGVVGYVVIFVMVFVTFSAAYLAMGTELAFKHSSYDVSSLWLAVSTILGFAAAVAGGYAAAMIGGTGAVRTTAVIVLIMGVLAIAMIALSEVPAEARTSAVSNLEAMGKARTPLWVAVINPIIGIAGVLIGGSLRKQARPHAGSRQPSVPVPSAFRSLCSRRDPPRQAPRIQVEMPRRGNITNCSSSQKPISPMIRMSSLIFYFAIGRPAASHAFVPPAMLITCG